MKLSHICNVELHCHSEDSLSRPADWVKTCHQGIDRLVVTDYHTPDGARADQTIDPVLVIVGEEIRASLVSKEYLI